MCALSVCGISGTGTPNVECLEKIREKENEKRNSKPFPYEKIIKHLLKANITTGIKPLAKAVSKDHKKRLHSTWPSIHCEQKKQSQSKSVCLLSN